ncbi:MAG: exodeoxyribonuclease VII small subunit [Verrucomicrobiota bacterium]|nr:exodeoxyribonuclease VII small subunit [Verrucomicrobiales bacterium]MEC9035250.1 exodeoxyribonuclease VII small subunit [Verrucomicrobiota bacterium]MEE2966883.1 exodeoxyribonuclease VII small subunit [Verrucomicrobiota bacterium]HAA88322.1 exodeoxyribonuclease VII small subunit [Verrucomicrobiales bacterium]|tara:strand:+ start:432 stop:716 length:285 start_codon:yes stop_codon:yes gene_type:complete
MPPSQKKGTEENLQFEEAIEKLESIIERMESEQIPLQELLKDYEEGTKLLKLCRDRIDGARQKVDKINKELTNGSVMLESLEDDGISSNEETDN